MAKMIPSFLNDDTRSAAERDIFLALRDALGTEEWVVLHSLNLTARDKKPYGEVDFVLLIPGSGIFAVEVKGGGLECNDGAWITVDRNGSRWPLKRSPFKQAQEGMWGLRDCLRKAMGIDVIDKVVFGSAAIFPDTNFDVASPEWADWEIIDKRACARGLVAALQRMATGHALRLRLDGKAFTVALLGKVRQVLRPDFECVMAAGTTLALAEQQLLKLTEEQFGALDALQFNDRLLCEGAAGTGKTMLALEIARREARAGKKVLLLCFNRLLGIWLSEQTREEANLTAGSFHQLGWDCIDAAGLLDEFNAHKSKAGFWDQAFLELAWQAVAELGATFDTLIVDEAQDLSSALTLEVLDAWLRGGIMSGRWAFFADFHRQAIFGGEQGRDNVTSRASTLVRWRLTVNCRNTKRIARETALLAGFDRPPYRMGQVDGAPVDSTFCKDDAEAAEKLAARITRFLSEGGDPNNLVVLAPLRLANSSAASIQKGAGFLLLDASEQALSRSRQPIVRFATVQAFKGMESQEVILCDVPALGDMEQQSLLYVGMSRARLKLTLILKAELRAAFDDCRAKQFSPDWK